MNTKESTGSHTPGTWRLIKIERDESENCPEHYEVLATVDGTPNVRIAEVFHDFQEWEEFEANAKLIAKAPTMLGLLTAAAEALEIEGENKALLREIYAVIEK